MINDFIHHNEDGIPSPYNLKVEKARICPVTGLDISMQPRNSKFLSSTGVQWYYDHNYNIFKTKLLPFLNESWKKNPIEKQFTEIAHSIRNAESNPRNNTRRKIQRILQQQNCLFNNLELIDKKKLKEAGMI